MPEGFARFDVADYLTSPSDAALFLQAAIEEAGDDPTYVAAALGAIARSGNMSELARRAGVTREGLYKALSTDGNPSFATVLKVTQALGLRLRVEAIPA
jgi:probable addiction module antidote protein